MLAELPLHEPRVIYRHRHSQDFPYVADMTCVTATAEHEKLRERALASLASLPPFSPILNRLIATLSREDVSFIKIAELIEKDTVLAGNVLRLVNSALYGRRATVNSVRHAVSLLGINKLRNATLGMSVTRMWNQVRSPAGWSMGRFNLHAVGTAMLADLLAQELPVEYAEGAFAAGLFHDLGRLLIALALPDEYSQIAIVSSGSHLTRSECEAEVLGFTHADLSADALAVWNLPDEIRVAVEYHHRPRPAEQEGNFSLSQMIAVADEMVNSCGYRIEGRGMPGFEPEILKNEAARIQALGIRNPERLLQTFVTEFEALRSLF